MRLLQLRTAGVLFISRAFAADGAPLVWHVHLLSNQRARLLYSLSLFRDNEDTAWRGMVGRANRLLHWNDLQAFQARGACIYDFGGYYRGTEDSAKLRINKFKSEFGGVLRVEYNGVRFLSLAGKAMAWVYRLRTASVNRRARQTAA
jgi:hypothetical protein